MNARSKANNAVAETHHGRLFIPVLATVLSAVFCWAQHGNAQAKYLGAISGVVTDSAGARIPDANVIATDTTTKFISKVVTDASGEYTIPFITPDTYDVDHFSQRVWLANQDKCCCDGGRHCRCAFTFWLLAPRLPRCW